MIFCTARGKCISGKYLFHRILPNLHAMSCRHESLLFREQCLAMKQSNRDNPTCQSRQVRANMFSENTLVAARITLYSRSESADEKHPLVEKGAHEQDKTKQRDECCLKPKLFRIFNKKLIECIPGHTALTIDHWPLAWPEESIRHRCYKHTFHCCNLILVSVM